MVILKAFIVNEEVAGWCDIWHGNSLRQLSTKDFDYFKSFYGLENLCLVHSFKSFDDVSDYNASYWADFSEDYWND